MNIRPCELGDWPSIIELSRQHNFPFPDFKNIVSLAVVVKDNKVIAFGYLKQMVEAVFIPDTSSKKDTVQSLSLLIAKMVEESRILNIGTIHAFVPKEDYPQHKDILIKHFNFHECNGDAVFLEVMNGS